MTKPVILDGRRVRSLGVAAQLMGIDRTTLWHVLRRGRRTYKGHSIEFACRAQATPLNRCPHCGEVIE